MTMLSVYIMCSLFKSEERAIGIWSERKKKRRKETKKLQLHYLNDEADDRRSKRLTCMIGG